MRNSFWPQELRGVAGEIGGSVERYENIGKEGFYAGFAGLGDDRVGQFVAAG
jgi:hypothetical protein